ncbi:MAG: chromosomal replication initiator protein DnaA [Fibrobacter sp.]|nr:chromosomal replication initiator protein DnaA [Fibrobacter sp.]
MSSVDKMWNKCLENLQAKLSAEVFANLFTELKLLEINERDVVALVPSHLDLPQYQSYKALVEMAWQEVNGIQINIEFKHPQSEVIKNPGPTFSMVDSVAMNSHYNFESFVVGDKSRFAYSAAYAVAQHPGGGKYNPMLIFGGTGLGKTHLLQAVGNYVLENHPSKKVRYHTAEDFSREYVESLKNHRINEMTNYYRNEVDVLLIDDIQFLSGKIETQNEFFHIFNSLYHSGKQIVLSSDVPPSEIQNLQDRLVSRFSWGLTVDIQPPDVETREAILRKKSESLNIEMDETVIAYLAESIEGNVRLLESAVRRLTLLTSVHKRDIDMFLAKEAVAEIVPTIQRKANIDSIIGVVSEHFSVSDDKLVAKGRGTKEVAQARQVAMYLMRKSTHLSLKAIGSRFGNRDHSTVVHAIKTVEENMEKEPSIRRSIESLQSSVRE